MNGGIGRDAATYMPANLYPGFPNIPSIPGRSTAVRIVEANLETLVGAKDFSEGDVLRSIESYTGGRNEDIITGVLSSNISDYLGDSNNDTIFGTSAANTIVGGAGGSIATPRSPRARPTATRWGWAAPARSPSTRRSTAMSATTRARISPRSG